jgi:hypothetical protein
MAPDPPPARLGARIEPERCSSISRAVDEPMLGTASTIRTWILVESPGPWGYDAVTENRLPEGFGAALEKLADRLRARAILIRRPLWTKPVETPRVFLARSGPGEVWIESRTINDPSDLLDADLSALEQGSRPGFGERHEGPLFLVCTNGRRDACCALRGRAVAAAMTLEFGEASWECSHIGGDRFAANLICLPHGLYFGRVEPSNAGVVARTYVDGRIDLERYRGRSCYAFGAQAAEWFLRNELDLLEVDGVSLEVWKREGGLVWAVFDAGHRGRHRVTVEVDRAERSQPLTCQSPKEARPPRYRLSKIEAGPRS